MSEASFVSIAHFPTDDWKISHGRSPPILTHKFCDLKERFHRLLGMIRSMSAAYQEDSEYRDEFHYLEAFDALTDEMQGVCRQLCTLRATRTDHLKLKISALLYLLPDEAGTETELAKSLLSDLEKNAFQFHVASSE